MGVTNKFIKMFLSDKSSCEGKCQWDSKALQGEATKRV